MTTRECAFAAVAVILSMTMAGCGPRMYDQPSIQAFERTMPAMPEGAVPWGKSVGGYPSPKTPSSASAAFAREAARTEMPVKADKRTLHNGRIYYDYYCVACHGQDGRGNGPVGQSYVPKPADLTSGGIGRLTPGELYRRMLTGTGHDPVMEHTVPQDQRWELALYVNSFSHSKQPASPPEPSR